MEHSFAPKAVRLRFIEADDTVTVVQNVSFQRPIIVCLADCESRLHQLMQMINKLLLPRERVHKYRATRPRFANRPPFSKTENVVDKRGTVGETWSGGAV